MTCISCLHIYIYIYIYIYRMSRFDLLLRSQVVTGSYSHCLLRLLQLKPLIASSYCYLQSVAHDYCSWLICLGDGYYYICYSFSAGLLFYDAWSFSLICYRYSTLFPSSLLLSLSFCCCCWCVFYFAACAWLDFWVVVRIDCVCCCCSASSNTLWYFQCCIVLVSGSGLDLILLAIAIR